MANKGYAHPLAIKSEADLRPALEKRDKYLTTWLNTYVPTYNDEDDTLYLKGGVVLNGFAANPPVVGARDVPEEALANLLFVLANMGLIQDLTTAT